MSNTKGQTLFHILELCTELGPITVILPDSIRMSVSKDEGDLTDVTSKKVFDGIP